MAEAHEDPDGSDLRDGSDDDLSGAEAGQQVLVPGPLGEHDAHLVLAVGVPHDLAADAPPDGRKLHAPGHPVDPGQAHGAGVAVEGEEHTEPLPADDLTGDAGADGQTADGRGPGRGSVGHGPAVLPGPGVLAHPRSMARARHARRA
ncbi:hypothetical protein Sros01_24750 [Streptomyces roseochromogenus]|nr:hypothetical protein Sros01_24750 [Streptomyces roseochromogenus]